MKKIMIIIISLILAISFLNIMVCATDVLENNTMDENLINILNSQLADDDLFFLNDKEKYHVNAAHIDISNKTILKIYPTVYFGRYDDDMESLVSYADSWNDSEYIILDGEMNILRKLKRDNGFVIALSTQKATEWAFVNDICNMSVDTEILGEQCKISNIYCFNGVSSHKGVAVYFVTDKGVFVKYYENHQTEGVWFSDEDYREYAEGYYNYLISPENNYSENGGLIGGGTESFLSYIENIYGNNDATNGAIAVYVTIALILTAGIVACVTLLKKRVKK